MSPCWANGDIVNNNVVFLVGLLLFTVYILVLYSYRERKLLSNALPSSSKNVKKRLRYSICIACIVLLLDLNMN